MSVRSYSPNDVTLTFGGYVLTNWDSIEVKRLQPSFKMVRGIRGKNTRIRTQNTAAEITITVPTTSITNVVLSEIVEQDEILGTGRIIVSIKDVSGMEVFNTPDAFIEGQAVRSYSSDMSTRVWTLQCMTSVITQSESVGIESIFDSIF